MGDEAGDDIERMIAAFEAAVRGRPDYPLRLVGIASAAAAKKHKLRAMELARKALALAPDDAQVAAEARGVLSSLLPGYHVAMMNDARRNPAWDAALRRAIRPGMHVLEIGTGAGMLALMAARAGAERVITCETNAVAAAMARELAARNGLADRIVVIDKASQDLHVGEDLERPADLLFCDIFADSFFDFEPLPAIADARRRLVRADAPTIPGFGGVRMALADLAGYARQAHIDSAAGFDLSPFTGFVRPHISVQVGEPGLKLMSEARDVFRFDLTEVNHPQSGAAETVLEASSDGTVNGVVIWIRLELDGETVLEARPEPGAVFFSAMRFGAFAEPVAVRKGDRLRVGTQHRGKAIMNWLAGRDG